ncbi:hypothetical protein E2C01_079514 [Portunus trituberculatus]|uniref:Uncharacterized protein n=1 Tax=Portunus trituberculatus TaxID=210409 RepID=A0A5B7IQI4_PORTR|nr:hypothetical protein [Portunus trituberculatus]
MLEKRTDSKGEGSSPPTTPSSQWLAVNKEKPYNMKNLYGNFDEKREVLCVTVTATKSVGKESTATARHCQPTPPHQNSTSIQKNV